MTIHVATPADLPDIHAMVGELAEYEKLAHTLQATEAKLGELLFGPDGIADALIARLGKEAIGFALFYENLSTFLGVRGLFLEDLFVRPAFRGRGAGTRLLEAFARLAVERGCGYVEWRALDWNTPAIELYKKRGAQPLSDWTVFRVSGADLARLGGAAVERH